MTTVYEPLLLVIVLIPVLALIPIVITRRNPNLRESWSLLAAAATIVLVLSLVPRVLESKLLVMPLFECAPGIELAFRVDGLGMLFAIVATVLWFVTTIYSVGYMRSLKEHGQTRYFCFFALAITSTLGVAFSGNLLTLYLFYELLSLSTYPLVTHHQDEEARVAGRKYLIYIVGTSIGLVLPAMMIIYRQTGSLDFTGLGILAGQAPTGMLGVVFLMMVFGFAKSGLMPVHRWLPGAMVAPTPVSALLHAVAVVKVGVFCVIRVVTEVFGVELTAALSFGDVRPVTIVRCVAAFTIVVSSVIALQQDGLKKRLAYSTIGQLSYIILGATLLTPLALTGSVMHIGMHAFGKITLFFCAGAIYVAVGKKNISEMVGIGRRMPLTMICFFVGSLSVIGLPPTGGILSKMYLVRGTLDAGTYAFLLVYLFSSLLNCAYFFPIVYKAFFCTDEERQWDGPVQEPPRWCIVPPVITAVLTVLLFVFPDIFLGLADVYARSVQ